MKPGDKVFFPTNLENQFIPVVVKQLKLKKHKVVVVGSVMDENGNEIMVMEAPYSTVYVKE